VLTSGLFSSTTPHWATPKALYEQLDAEFRFDDDPCPLHGEGGFDREWGRCVFVNPPYGREITAWVRRAYEESLKGKTVVCLVPSRTDTRWWHEYVMKAWQIRFIRGRLHFNESPQGAPFPSAIVIFAGTT
jgi:site-specific DNA-methyltransferase (adenine-specific)